MTRLCLIVIALLVLPRLGNGQQIVEIPDSNFLQKLVETQANVDKNGDGLIQVEEAEAVTKLTIRSREIESLIGIEAFVNLVDLDCSNNLITNLDLSNNLELIDLSCSNNLLTNLELSNNLKLQDLYCSDNKLTELKVNDLVELVKLDCADNLMTSLDIRNNLKLYSLTCSDNSISDLDISNNLVLGKLLCWDNQLSTIDFSNNLELIIISCSSNNLTEIDVSKNLQLESLHCSSNNLTNIDVTNNLELNNLSFSRTLITNIDLSNNLKLGSLTCDYVDLDALDLSHNLELSILFCIDAGLDELDLSKNVNLYRITCRENNIVELDFSNNPILYYASIYNNQLESIDVSECPDLSILTCSGNNLTELDLSKNLGLWNLWTYSNPLKELDLSNNLELSTVIFGNDSITEWDFSQHKELRSLKLRGNAVSFLNISNGTALSTFDIEVEEGPLTICMDESDYDVVEPETDPSFTTLMTNCALGFGGTTYDLMGQVLLSREPVCDSLSDSTSELHFVLDNGKESIYKPTYNQNSYSIKLPPDEYTIALNLENPDLFNVDPDTLLLELDSITSPFTQDFCLWPNGDEVADVKVTIIPVNRARPGFEVKYIIHYENQGNVKSSGTVQLRFPAEVAQYISSDVPVMINQDLITVDYIDLIPFEQREFSIVMRLNSPMDMPPLLDGTLSYIADIVPDEKEHYQPDNHFELVHSVVNSFDPNDKTCLQGDKILDEMIGEYVNFLIRFENEGTASAVDITILDKIDTTVFDISTIIVTESSDPVYLNTNGNVAQFVFQQIYLPFDEEFNQGHVSYKIKTLPNLAVGDSLTNSADIFFDFNFPITTNTTVTTVVTDMDGDGFDNLEDCDDQNPNINPSAEEVPGNLVDEDCDGVVGTVSVHELSNTRIKIFPNPTAGLVNLSIEGPLSFQSTVYNLQGQIVQSSTNDKELFLSSIPSGTYLLEIKDLKTGQRIVEKLVVEKR